MKILFFLLLNVSLLFARSYEVDVANSSVEFKVRHMVFSTTKGTFENFSGEYAWDEEKNELLSLKGEVLTNSVGTEDKERDDYLKSDTFFDVKKYPKMTLVWLEKSTAKLTIKGVSKEVPFKIEASENGFIMIGEISRKEFGLHFGSLAEAGGIAVGDSVKIFIQIAGKK